MLNNVRGDEDIVASVEISASADDIFFDFYVFFRCVRLNISKSKRRVPLDSICP